MYSPGSGIRRRGKALLTHWRGSDDAAHAPAALGLYWRAEGKNSMDPVGILIVDDDEASQAVLRHMLDSEGWKLRIVSQGNQALAELASGKWTLVIVNVAITGVAGPVFSTLKELALAPAATEAGRIRARVLFLVPEMAGPETQAVLEQERLPYVLKPFHLHDFLDKVSDLLLETNAISAPIRRIRYGLAEERFAAAQQRRTEADGRPAQTRRETAMFSSRRDYLMTEEEIAEFEKQEKEESKKKQKARKELGRP